MHSTLEIELCSYSGAPICGMVTPEAGFMGLWHVQSHRVSHLEGPFV